MGNKNILTDSRALEGAVQPSREGELSSDVVDRARRTFGMWRDRDADQFLAESRRGGAETDPSPDDSSAG